VAWTYLFVAGLVEIAMVLLLRASQGWTRLWPGLFGIVAGGISVFLLTNALKTLPAGTAYAVWTGIGSVGVAAIGIAVFNENSAPARLLCIALVVAGMVGLRLLEEA
jgi:quaternary ammonium compound-resistance protein SugE